jgi:hypothetical protein
VRLRLGRHARSWRLKIDSFALVDKEQIMKRITWLPAILVAIVAFVSLTVVVSSNADAGPYGGRFNGGYYWGGAYAPAYGGYAVYGGGPYAYRPPAAYAYPAYSGYGYQGYGAGPYGYGYARGYSAYGYRGYSPYGAAYSPYGFQPYSGY